jgi:hypothetical protein
MANQLITPTWVLKDVGLAFTNSVVFIEKIRQFDNRYEFGGAKVGNTVQYRLPQQWLVSDGQALQEQPILDATVNVSLTNQKHIDFAWSSAQATTEIEEVRARYTKPAGNTLASACDSFTFNAVYRDVYQTVGTPGTTPNATLTYLQAGVKLSDVATPRAGRIAVLDSMAMATIANTSSTLFNPSAAISENYRDGQFSGRQLGYSAWYEDQNRPAHTTGTFTASTPILSSAGQTGSSITTTGWAAGAAFLKRGDKFNIAGVFSVNPLSKQSTGRLQDFVFTADTNDTAGSMTIPLSPPIIITGALQNVSNAPANGAAVTVWAAAAAGGVLATTVSPQSIVFNPEAFAFVTADLAMPIGGAESSRISSPEGGFSLRIAKQWDIRSDQNITRIDTLIGAATLQSRLACRVVG